MKKWWILFIVCIANTHSLRASSKTNQYAQITTPQNTVFLGKVFPVDILLNTPSPPQAPTLNNLPNFHITTLQNAKPTPTPNTYLFRYAFRATSPGKQTIPPLKFTYKNGTISTRPLPIQVKKPKKTDRMTLELKLSKNVVYKGEPLLLSVRWDTTYPLSTIRAVDFNFPYFSDPRFKLLNRYEPQAEKNKNATGLPVQGTRILAKRKSYTKNKTRHQTLTFSKLLIPQKTGKFTLPQATLLCAAEKEKPHKKRRNRNAAFQYPAYFNNTFFNRNATTKNWTRIYTESATPTLEVKPLPTKNRPQLFNGMIGNYSISVQAQPRHIHVGDPITLTIEIKAKTFMENIKFPPLRYQPLLLNKFKIPSERALPDLTHTSKIYTQTIRPLSTNIVEIPALQLAYFSPTSNAYIIAKSTPIPITIDPALPIAIFQNTPNTNPLCLACKIILILLSLLLTALTIWGTRLLIQHHKKHAKIKKQAEKALHQFKKSCAKIEKTQTTKQAIYTQLDQALRSYFAARFNLHPNALTFKEIRTILQNTPSNTIDQLETLFNLCEAYRFTQQYNEPANPTPILTQAQQQINQLEKKLSTL